MVILIAFVLSLLKDESRKCVNGLITKLFINEGNIVLNIFLGLKCFYYAACFTYIARFILQQVQDERDWNNLVNADISIGSV
jgi:hypothetical protein